MTYGEKEEKLRAFAEETGQVVPALEAKPKLSLELGEIVQGFRILCNVRTSNGFGLNPISLTEVKAYIEIVGVPWVGVTVFLELITATDRVYLNKIADMHKKESALGKGESGGKT